MKSKEWAKFELEFIYSNSEFKVNEDFEYASTSGLISKEKPKISNITFAILPFYQKKILNLNGHPVYFRIYTTLHETVRNGSFQHKNA